MKIISIKTLIALVVAASCFHFTLNAQNNMDTNQILTAKQQSIIPIAGFTAKMTKHASQKPKSGFMRK